MLEPPYDNHGSVTPVSGMRPVTPPTMTKTCSASENDSPAASSLPNESRHDSAARSPRSTMRPNSSSTAMTPTRPSSSPMAAMMKSVLANGTTPGLPSPRPVPVRPPVPKPNSDCTSWNPAPSGSANGSSQVSTRRCT